jgi:hypothetical protein
MLRQEEGVWRLRIAFTGLRTHSRRLDLGDLSIELAQSLRIFGANVSERLAAFRQLEPVPTVTYERQQVEYSPSY